MTQKYIDKVKKLDEISHVLLRPGRYLGSISPHTSSTYIVDEVTQKMIEKELTWTPALIKIFDEVITNSVDFSKTPEGKHVSTIKVDIDKSTGEIAVYDDGGIPVLRHPEYDQYIPEMIFELRAGTNFNDEEDSTGSGQNGEGAGLTNIFSSSFNVKTCDGKKSFDQTHSDNSRTKTIPKIKSSDKNGTKITFIPDYEKLNLTGIDEGNYKKLVKRVYDVAGCNPNLKVYLNGKHIKIKSFKDYIEFYTDEYVFDENEHWKVGIGKSPNGNASHVSFVNTTETTIGGNHIKYIQEQISTQLREYFKKKHKVDVRPSEILNHIQLFIDATIIKPRYSSQTKEDLITESKNFGTKFVITDKVITKLTKSEVIKSILDWVEAKAFAEERKALRQLDKESDKQNPNRVDKFCDATEKTNRQDCMLFLTEGDSASKAVISAKTTQNAKYIGSFPLKGKPLNVNDVPVKDLIENKEFKSIMTIMGLRLGDPVKSISDLRFGKLIIMSDQDLDGFHINGLLLNMINRFWPELFTLGVIYRFKTPIIKIFLDKKKIVNFFTEADFNAWKLVNPDTKYKMKYYKGLATSTPADFKSYMENMDLHLVPYSIEDDSDKDAINLAFSKDKGAADKRKEWLDLL